VKPVKRARWLIPIVAVAIVCLSVGCCAVAGRRYTRRADLSGFEPMSVTVDEAERSAFVYVPPTHDGSEATSLVLVLHGGGGTAAGMIKLTQGLDTIADREGFIIAYPAGVDKHWNDGREITGDADTDDVGFLSALIDHISADYAIDSKRVYATGISNGGFMSFRLACELSDKIAAIAPVTAALSEDLYATCSPSEPVSVLVVNGTHDPLVPWDGGTVGFGLREPGRGQALSTADTIAYWVARNRCAAGPDVLQLPDADPKDGTRVRWEVHGQCDGSSEVVLCEIEGGGHTWPRGWQYLPEGVIGATSQDVEANEVIWQFFQEHPKE
jgi:polyhydroxybutyrate depolymerase